MITCLIAEADPFLAKLLQRFGEASGMAVIQARVGQQVVALVAAHRPDVMVLEVELPGELRGWEAIREIRRQYGVDAIPLITCSWLCPAEVQTLIGEPAVAHLQKPELHYQDFATALAATGVAVSDTRLDL